jgi:hypothetical protein
MCSFLFFFHKFLNLTFENRQLFPDTDPGEMPVHPEIPVRYNIPDPGKTAPVNLRVTGNQRCRQVLGCFSNHLDVPEDRVLCPVISHQLIKRDVPAEGLDLFYCLENIVKQEAGGYRFSDINDLMHHLVADQGVQTFRCNEVDPDFEPVSDQVF